MISNLGNKRTRARNDKKRENVVPTTDVESPRAGESGGGSMLKIRLSVNGRDWGAHEISVSSKMIFPILEYILFYICIYILNYIKGCVCP